jgi:hypothetical protein
MSEFSHTKNQRSIVLLYLLLLLCHIVHVFEEIWGRFIAIEVIGSLTLFLAVNVLVFAVVLSILYFYLLEKRWAIYAAIFYAIAMSVNGLGHIAATLLTGHYFSGFAGAASGVALLIVGLPLAYKLTKEVHLPHHS